MLPIYREETYENDILISFIEIYDDNGTVKWTDGSTTRDADEYEIEQFVSFVATHVSEGNALQVSYNITEQFTDIPVDASAGTVTLTVDENITTGKELYISKMDDSSNNVVINADMVNGDSSYELMNQGKYVTIKKMGNMWAVRSNN